MNQGEWRLFRVRPANHPRRRIAGMAEILGRFLDRGLAVGLGEMIAESSPAKLTAALSVSAGYVSIGSGPAGSGLAFVGQGRARDLAVNAVLPFMNTWAGSPITAVSRKGPGPYDALALYHLFPRLGDNELYREMAEQLLPQDWRGVVNTARRQQGLLHLNALMKGSH